MALNPGWISLDDIISAAKQRSDMVNSTFVTDAEWQSYVNFSYAELYDLLIQSYGNDYFVASPSYTFSTDGTNDHYALPSDFYKLLGVDSLVNGNTQTPITLTPFAFQERNQFALPGLPVAYGAIVPKYRLNGNTLWLIPTPPPAGLTIKTYYAPLPIPLQDTGTITLNSVNVGNTIVITVGSTSVTFTAVFSNPGANQFLANAVDNALASATSLAAAITASTLNRAQTAPLTATASAGFNDFLATVTVTMNGNSSLTWSASSSMSLSPTTGFTNIVDSYSGWIEYVIVDAAIKAMQKQESDVSVLMAQKQALKIRIESASQNRDAGEPATVADASLPSGPWGMSRGSGFGGFW